MDELAEFLHARARNQRLEQGDLPPNIAELFDQFVERKDLLTEAERNILRYYIDGHEISEIPDLAFISMSTVRKHNRSIYEKLGVASRDELMLYLTFSAAAEGFRSFSKANCSIQQRAQNQPNGFVRVLYYPMDTFCKMR